MNRITKKKFGIKRKEVFNKKLAIQVLFSIVLVAAVIVAKKVDTDYSKQFISTTENKIDESLEPSSIKQTFLKVFASIKDKIPFASKSEDKLEFAAPVNGKIMQKYGMAKKGEKTYYNHGLDILSNTETVKSISKGIVAVVDNNEKLSNYVVVIDDGKTIIYGQINEILVEKGDKISKGDIIGALSDESKLLHLEVWENGESINPTKLFEINE
ncbi:MAG: M23 family metallopeptidase [Tissierellia bacterium]|nr:M23 family metallopeptidase [Tissierellia bacterium]